MNVGVESVGLKVEGRVGLEVVAATKATTETTIATATWTAAEATRTTLTTTLLSATLTAALEVNLCSLCRSEDFEELGQVLLIYVQLCLLSSETLLNQFCGFSICQILEVHTLFVSVFAFGVGGVLASRLIVKIEHLESGCFVVVELHLLGEAVCHAVVQLCGVDALTLSSIVLCCCGY